MGDHPAFKRSLVGIHPDSASSYLRQLKKLQEQEAAELEEKVRLLQEENAKLRAELSEAMARQRASASHLPYQDLIRRRGEAVQRVLQQYAQEELNSLQAQIEQKRQEHHQKISRIEQQTESYKQMLQGLLQEFGATMQKFNASALDDLEDLELPVLAEQLAADLVAEPEADADVKVPLPDLTDSSQELNASNATNATNESPAPRTQEAAVEPVEEKVPPILKPVEPASKPKRVSQAPSSAFWGSIQTYVDGEDSSELDMLSTLEASATVELSAIPEEAEDDLPQTRGAEPRAITAADVQHMQEGGESKASEAMSTEIMSIRNRYIVGKIAGDDLLDHQGRLIVAKNETISAEVVQIAESQGRLLDLIVNMKIPGVSADKP